MRTRNSSRLKYYIPKLSPIDLVFFRIGGPGLGNLLFPIARAFVDARKSNGIFINGTFPQIKLGPLLRMEKDKRFYGREFIPLPLKKRVLRILLSTRRSTAEVTDISKDEQFSVIYYSGMANFFYPLLGWEDDIREFLYAENYFRIKRDFRAGIAVHLRLGDFAAATKSTGGTTNTQNSVDWYWAAIEESKKLLGTSTRVTLFSDNPIRARKLFPEFRVWESSENALSELLIMSQFESLVGANSTFSLWASFLGQGSSIWHKNFNLERYRGPNQTDHFV